METAVATFGGILLLFSLGGGILAKCNCLRANDQSHNVDRIGAGLVGIGLIATAIVIAIGAPVISLLTTFGYPFLGVGGDQFGGLAGPGLQAHRKRQLRKARLR